MSRTVPFDYPCPYPLCIRQERHQHPICNECGSTNYENDRCQTCRTVGPVYRNGLITLWRDAS